MSKTKNRPSDIQGMKLSHKDGITYVDVHSVKCGAVFKELRNKVSNDCPAKWIGATLDKRQRMLDKGAEEQVKAAQEFAKKVERKIPVKTSAYQMQNVVAGGAVSVGRFLAGNPVCFTRPALDTSASNPVRVFVDLGCSEGVSQAVVEKRGLAILAFAYLLSKSRPVELVGHAYVQIGRKEVCVRIT